MALSSLDTQDLLRLHSFETSAESPTAAPIIQTQESYTRLSSTESRVVHSNSGQPSLVKIVATCLQASTRALLTTCAQRGTVALLPSHIRAMSVIFMSAGWIDISGVPIYAWESPRILVTEVSANWLTKRSLVYMQCLLLGFTIVQPKWLADSLIQGNLLPVYGYEVQGTVSDVVPMAPLRSRCMSRTGGGAIALLHGYTFCIVDESTHELSAGVAREEVAWLVAMAGGQLLPATPPVSAQPVTVGLHLDLTLRIRSKVIATEGCTGGAVYSVSWLYDAICNLRLPSDLAAYRLPAS